MKGKITAESIRKDIETCERYQRDLSHSDVKVTNLRIGKTAVSADINVVESGGHARKRRNRYDIILL